MLSKPLDMDCRLALIEKRHSGKFFRFLGKNKERYRGVLHFVEKIKDEKDAEAFIMSSLEMMIRGELVGWGLWHKDDIIGEVSVRDINEEFKSAEIAYFIDKDYEGHGLISQACGLLIEYVFREFDIERLELGCDVNNAASQRIADKFGFVKEGIARKGFIAEGRLIDCAIYSLLKSEYAEAFNQIQAVSRNEL